MMLISSESSGSLGSNSRTVSVRTSITVLLRVFLVDRVICHQATGLATVVLDLTALPYWFSSTSKLDATGAFISASLPPEEQVLFKVYLNGIQYFTAEWEPG